MLDDVLRFGKIEIIEWLRPDDMRTGWDLLNEVEPMGIMSVPTVRAQYRQVWTRAEFLAALGAIENEFSATGMLPLLHIETHGSVGGIGASDQEGIAFAELMEELIPLNRMFGSRPCCGPGCMRRPLGNDDASAFARRGSISRADRVRP